MKNKIISIISISLGILIGCLFGIKANLSGWNFFREIFYGLVISYSIVDAFLKDEEKYEILIGAIIGLLIAISLDWFAGSLIIAIHKLVYIMVGSFIGWGASWGSIYWKTVLFGGVIGGIIGIILGLSRGCVFGLVYLPAGVLNAGLTFMQLSVVGMGLGSLYLKSIGWRHLEKSFQ